MADDALESREKLEEEPRRWRPTGALPRELATVEAAKDLDAGGWHFRVVPPDDGELYAHVAGDGGAHGVYVLRVFFWPLHGVSAPRHPTMAEWSEAADELCLSGAIMACQWIAGGGRPPLEGFGLVITVQTGAVEGSPAGVRLRLALGGKPSLGVH